MKILARFFFVLTLILAITARVDAAEKILFVPVDDRPVSFKQSVEILEQAGFEMIVPPKNFFDNPDELVAWLEKNAPSADAAVISSDAILYGGLIPSRKHEFSAEILDNRLNCFKMLRRKNPRLKIYVVASLMRTPQEGSESSIEEPDYYATYGASIFKYSSLAGKEKSVGLTSGERADMDSLKKNIPAVFLGDWLSRRRKNLDATENLIDLTRKGIINYLIVGQDDHTFFSQTQFESNELFDYAQNLSVSKFQMLSGTDEFGLLLLARAVDDLRGITPKIFVEYNEGSGAATIPAYSDEMVSDTIRSELYIAGGELVNDPTRADFVLLVNTDPAGETYHVHNALPNQRNKDFDYNAPRDGTENFVNLVEKYVNEGYAVCVADITFANGADNPMMNLLKERGLLFKLQAYAGWNTATNSLGFVLGTGILSRYMTQDAKDKILATRYLDDWAYQANVRTTVGDWIYYNMPNGANFYGDFGGKNPVIERRITNLMREFAANNLPPYEFLMDFIVTCAWNRMFEIDIEFKH